MPKNFVGLLLLALKLSTCAQDLQAQTDITNLINDSTRVRYRYTLEENCYALIPSGQNPSDCQQSSLDFNCTLHPRIRHQISEEESDGVVLKSSQIGYPGRRFEYVRMENTNHMQKRNCNETMKRLNELFNGEYGWQFELGEK